MLKVEKLNVAYAGIPVLRGVALAVNEVEIGSVVGANGGGKTTLLRAISGLLRPRLAVSNSWERRLMSFLPTRSARGG